MSEYLLRLYRPIADALLEQYALAVPYEERDALARGIMSARVVGPRKKGGSYTPLPAFDLADTHTKWLVKYVSQRPSRTSSIPAHCEAVAAALRDPHAGWSIILSCPDFDLVKLVESLDLMSANPPTMSVEAISEHLASELNTLVRLLEIIGEIRQARKKGAVTGRPQGPIKPIVRCAYIIWRLAGRPESFTWGGDDMRSLSGLLPNFLREILACCDGSHALMAPLERLNRPKPPQSIPLQGPKPRGYGAPVSDDSLHMLIADCIHDDRLAKYIERRRKEGLS